MVVTVRTALLSVVGTLGLLVVGFSGLNAYDAFRRYQANAGFIEANDASEVLLKLATNLAVERGLTNAPLHAAEALSADHAQDIARIRAASDETLPHALIQLRRITALAASQQTVDELEAAYRAYGAFRREVDQNLVKKQNERSSDVVDKFTPTMTGVIDRTDQVRTILEALVTSPDADVAQLVHVRSLVAEMAEQAGRERDIFAGNIAQRAPFTDDDMRKVSEHRGQIDLVWSALQAFRLRPDLPVAVTAAISQVGDAYMQRLTATRQAVLAAASLGTYPLTGREWVDQSAIAIGAISRLTDVISATTHEAAGGSASAALRNLVVYLGLMAFGMAVSIFSFGIVTRHVVRPLAGVTAAMRRLAEGDRTVAIPGQGRRDEVGQMAKAVDVFKQNLIETDRLRTDQEDAEHRAEAEKRAAMNRMADEFESNVKGIVQSVSSASAELRTTAQSMSAAAEQTERQSTVVAAAAGHASGNVETVAAAAQELSTSVAEVGRQVGESTEIARLAVEDANRTNAQVQMLADAVGRIGDVVKLINDIAGQTNLLALNATIEAARAGEAGKGFAVVASEVKTLASQTAKATDDIASQIKAIQNATGESVEAIRSVGRTIGRTSEIATAIASAIEEQTAATTEIARNVERASSGTTEVSTHIAGVTRTATDTRAAAGQVLSAADALSRQSETLHAQVDAFIAKIRAA
jgi:methyl-accepting chemotaxis protein